ncbi:hypothetical protein MKX79_03925 [Viridibacillus sp. FSL R5-0468]|uniref:hypothetical protein n=1 Tax=Viridibacillus sp. FSL R5-0468 TaxID=2921640 RepID=UPI0030F7E6D9
MKNIAMSILSVALLLALVACNKKDDEEKSMPVANNSETVAEVNTTEQTSNNSDEQIILDIMQEEEFFLVDLAELEMNKDASSKNSDDKVALVHFTFNAPNSAANAQNEIEKYTTLLAAQIIDKNPDISKMTVFWEAPELKEDWNVAKFNYVRTANKNDMTLKNTYFDKTVFN